MQSIQDDVEKPLQTTGDFQRALYILSLYLYCETIGLKHSNLSSINRY